jgi:hypothetical protein
MHKRNSSLKPSVKSRQGGMSVGIVIDYKLRPYKKSQYQLNWPFIKERKHLPLHGKRLKI